MSCTAQSCFWPSARVLSCYAYIHVSLSQTVCWCLLWEWVAPFCGNCGPKWCNIQICREETLKGFICTSCKRRWSCLIVLKPDAQQYYDRSNQTVNKSACHVFRNGVDNIVTACMEILIPSCNIPQDNCRKRHRLHRAGAKARILYFRDTRTRTSMHTHTHTHPCSFHRFLEKQWAERKVNKPKGIQSD